MRGQLQNLATACDRTGISDRSAAFIVNAALLDLNVIGTDDSSKAKYVESEKNWMRWHSGKHGTQKWSHCFTRKTPEMTFAMMCSVISAGTVSPNLAIKDPGKLTHYRWLTCANRILRLYSGTANPTKNLKELANFIMKVYAPTWFDIKTKLYDISSKCLLEIKMYPCHTQAVESKLKDAVAIFIPFSIAKTAMYVVKTICFLYNVAIEIASNQDCFRFWYCNDPDEFDLPNPMAEELKLEYETMSRKLDQFTNKAELQTATGGTKPNKVKPVKVIIKKNMEIKLDSKTLKKR
ncbi:hypothetical protein HELRODRAFT_173188 [Helobdella robusta]|uniref:Uncharacterized protein n=1 Tax=Helobdella robusta TaxID=6412 RepID=T1F6I8_HELRO|nr:hypothetical protein HELRODRAFT_173188 [Helobdella robusta]ESO04101.1 hypothetical protein HELRODRAFT_173188 [Helobdella robusta]